MTSLSTIGTEQHSVEGRSVRDIVETSPELVNEAWCRKIFRQILQSLELQYAMHMPHRAITPDTVVFHENGEPLLVPVQLDGAAPHEAQDLAALAAIVHYAITREPVPGAPLRGRAPEGYSESLLTAVDRCLAPDPAERPGSIEALRDILGIVSLGTPPPAPAFAAQPVPAPRMRAAAATSTSATSATDPRAAPQAASAVMRTALPSHDTHGGGAGLGRWQRWAVAAGGGAILLAIALVMFAELRDSGSYDHIVLTLPQTGDGARDTRAQASSVLPATPATPAAGIGAAGATVGGTQDGAAPDALSGAGAGDGTGAVASTVAGSGTSAGTPAGTGGVAGTVAGTGTSASAPAGAGAAAGAAAGTGTSAGAASPTPPIGAAGSAFAHVPTAGIATAGGVAPGSLAVRDGAGRPVPVRGMAPAATAVARSGASYRLRIQPWGVVYVDGVDRGVSPPVKRLVLAPGRHTLRIANPAYPDRVLAVDPAGGDGVVAVDFNDDTK